VSKPPTASPEFDDPFDTEDDFTAPADDHWRAAQGLGGLDEPDPFMQPQAQQTDPFADVPAAASTAQSFNPVGEMLAGAEAALGEVSVPRINIHIFCEKADIAAVAEKAAADRRLDRATTSVQMGGLTAAVAQYQNQPTPALVIVESLDPGPILLDQLGRMAEVCDTGTKVIVIGAHNDIALYRELMRQGVSEYLVPPLQTLPLVRAITNLYADPSAPFLGRQIAFIGARGGVGSSTIAHNVAHMLTERLLANAVIVDFDLPFGTAGLDFNQDPLHGVADALSQPDRLDPVLLERMMARCTERLSLFAAPATLDDDYDISTEAFEEVAAKIRTTAPYVVLDLPHTWSNWIRRMLLTADDVVVTAAPDLACLRNAKNIIDLVRQARPNDTPPVLVLNQVGLPGRPEISAKDFAEALGVPVSAQVGFDGKLFGQAANNGHMLDEVGPRSKAVEQLSQLTRLVSRRDAPPPAKKSPFAGLFKLK
jgi:pilus assembly protein CpaE